MRKLLLLVVALLWCGLATAQTCPVGANNLATGYATHATCTPNCYVATTGNDCTGNGTIGNPWKTPYKCVAEAYPGDTCWLRAGTYTSPSPGSTADATVEGGWQDHDRFGWLIGFTQNQTLYPSTDPTNWPDNNTPPGHGGSAGNHVFVRAYGAEHVEMNSVIDSDGPGRILFTGDAGDTGRAHHMTFMDITFRSGEVHIGNGGNNLTFERCVFYISGGPGDNSCALGGGFNQQTNANIVIRNNLFISDNTTLGPSRSTATAGACTALHVPDSCCTGPGTGSCPGAWSLNGGQDQQMMDMYSMYGNSIIEHNDFIITADSLNPYIVNILGMKGSNGQTIVQYNYIIDKSSAGAAARGIWLGNHQAGELDGNIVRYNVLHNAGAINQWYLNYNELIHNNTIYSSSDACWLTRADPPPFQGVSNTQFFNNICWASAPGPYHLEFCSLFGGTSANLDKQLYVNNNIYWKTGSGTKSFLNGTDCAFAASESGSLTAWQTYAAANDPASAIPAFESASRLINPGLTNPTAFDYSLVVGAAARTGGHGGGFPVWLGADDPNSTTDYVGCNFDPRCHGYGLAPATCGNGIVEPGEQCDGANLNLHTCAEFGCSTGQPTCTSCQITPTGCGGCTAPLSLQSGTLTGGRIGQP